MGQIGLLDNSLKNQPIFSTRHDFLPKMPVFNVDFFQKNPKDPLKINNC